MTGSTEAVFLHIYIYRLLYKQTIFQIRSTFELTCAVQERALVPAVKLSEGATPTRKFQTAPAQWFEWRWTRNLLQGSMVSTRNSTSLGAQFSANGEGTGTSSQNGGAAWLD